MIKFIKSLFETQPLPQPEVIENTAEVIGDFTKRFDKIVEQQTQRAEQFDTQIVLLTNKRNAADAEATKAKTASDKLKDFFEG